jgi:hypothetical protein
VDQLKQILSDFSSKMDQKPPSKEMLHADHEIIRHIEELGAIHRETAKLVTRMSAMFSQKVDELSLKVEAFEKRLSEK